MSESDHSIRTRFAPSPTGFMHVGGVRTALFAWFLARKSPDGKFILRIEDTDQKREVEGSADHIIRSLNALNLNYDEGPQVGGPYAPYFQSKRLDIYRRWARQLIDAGRAYADPYTPEQLDQFRDQAKLNKQAFLYRNHRPENPPAWDGSQPLRFKSEPKAYAWHDEVYGDLHSGPEVVDDFILIKSDGFPTYNFAHIVDDAEMKVSHIIRGQEFLASMPNYLNLYEALGLERPIFATMPHILAPSGTKKLSKRDGAKDVLDYLSEGYLQEALVNFIASLGWNDGTEQEVFSVEELIAKFSLDRVGHSGARFDEQRLLWLNGQWIRRLSLDDLYARSAKFWPETATGVGDGYKKQVLALVKDRLKTLGDLRSSTSYFFATPEPDWGMVADNKQLNRVNQAELKRLLAQASDALQESDFTPQALQNTLDRLLQSTGQKPAILFSMVRLAVSWAPFSPALNDTLATIGKAATLERIQTAINS